MDLGSHSKQPVRNEVVVEDGLRFRSGVLSRRIQPLLKATTLGQVLDALDPTARSLGVLGTVAYQLELGENAQTSPNLPLEIVTRIRLTDTSAPNTFRGAALLTSDIPASISGQAAFKNGLRLGETFTLAGQLQPNPTALGSGSAVLETPLPTGAGKLALAGFFFNQDRFWASYRLASHGISAQIKIPWSADLAASFGVEAVARNVHSLADTACDEVRAAADAQSLKACLKGTLLHTGKKHSLGIDAELASGPGDARFLKLVTAGKFDQSFFGPHVQTTVSGSAGYIHGAAKVFDRFVIGGAKDLHGFAYNKVGPCDNGDFVGGHAFYTLRSALHLPFPSKKLCGLKLTALGNIGALKAHTETKSSVSDNLRSLAGLKPTAAVAGGLTYSTDAASFEILYVSPLRHAENDVTRPGVYLGAGLSLE